MKTFLLKLSAAGFLVFAVAGGLRADLRAGGWCVGVATGARCPLLHSLQKPTLVAYQRLRQ